MKEKAVKGTYAKDHGTAKKGDERVFSESTIKALQAHGVLEVEKKAKDKKKSDKDKSK